MKKILLGGLGIASICFGASFMYDNKNMNDYLETHKEFKQYLYLQQYQNVLDYTANSYSKNITNNSKDKQKDIAQKVEKNIGLAVIQIEQQKMLYDEKEIKYSMHQWQKMSGKRSIDELLFWGSLLGLAGALFYNYSNNEKNEN